MTDYIELPSIIKSINDIGEGKASAFLKDCKKINENQFSLDALRALYVKDNKAFIQIVDEMALRGFYFYTEKPNNILPSRRAQLNKYIKTQTNLGRFKIIDFQKLGLSGFIHRYGIQSDLFFYNVPLDGFRSINSNIDLTVLENELVRVGFTIVDVDQLDSTLDETLQDETIEEQEDPSVNSTSKEENNGTSQRHENVAVNELFPEEKFWNFRSLCKRRGIQTVEEITEPIIEEYGAKKGVGSNRLTIIKERLNLNTGVDPSSGTDHSKTTTYSIIHSTANEIEKAFEDNTYRTFREFCKKKHITTLDEIKEHHFQEYSDRRGVGVGKVDAVIKRVHFLMNKSHIPNASITDNNEQHQQTPVFINEVFSEEKYMTFRIFCKKNKIYSISDLTEQHYTEYSNIKGVGIGKVEAVKTRVAEYLHLANQPISTQMSGQELEETIPSSEILSVLIEELFSENTYLTFRKYCKKNKIRTIFEVTSKHLEKYFDMRGVGVGKYEAVKQRIQAARVQNSKPLNIRPSVASQTIRTTFNDKKHDVFREFCEEQGIHTLGQLETRHLQMFSSYKNVSMKRVDQLRQLLDFYVESSETQSIVFESGDIFETIQGMPVGQLLELYGYQSTSQSNLKIKDVEGKRISDLQDTFEPHLLFDLSNRLKIQKHPRDIAEKFKTVFTDREYLVLKHRYGYEETLEEVGSRLGVTRERVRQIGKGVVRKVVTHLGRERFATGVRLVAKHQSFLKKGELVDLVGHENQFLVHLLIQEKLYFKYYHLLEFFFIDEAAKVDIKVIEDCIEELPDSFHVSEYRQTVEEQLKDLNIEDIGMEILNSLVENNHYYKYGEIYSKHRLKITHVLTYLFRHYIKKPLRIDEEGVLYLHELAMQHMNFELSKTVRSIEARIRDVESLILVDRATFQYFDRENFDPSILSKIESYIDEQFERKKEIINVEEVYEKFQGLLEQHNVHNKIHLYSLIRCYLDEKYMIGQGNTLNIYKNKKSKQSVEERLVAYMKKHGGICSKDQLLEVVSPLFKVDIAINSSNQMIGWGNKSAILVDKLNIKTNEKAMLLEFFDQSFKKGYATANSMYKDMMFDRKLSKILRDKNIDDPSKLPAIIKLFKPTVKGHTNYLYIEGFELDSFEKVIEAHFTAETSRQEIKEFIYEHGYKEMMVTNFLKRVLDNEIFVEIDMDQLYPAKLLQVNEAELAEIETYVREKMGDGEYLSLSHLKGYRRKLPDIGFRWNPHLLQSVLQRCGFRQVKKTFNDYRYDKVIVVREESSIQSFEDLILYVLKNEYEGNLHEIAIYEFLMEKGIVREQEYMHKKVLPYEIKTSERLHFDELGIVTVKKG